MNRKLKAIYLIVSAVIVGFFIIHGVIPEITPVKEVLAAEQKMKFAKNHLALKLFSDGTYTYTTDYWRINSIKKYTGEYSWKKDTIYFSDILPNVKSKKAVIKNNIIEFQNKELERLTITKTILKFKSKIDYKKHPDFAVFTFTPEAYKYNLPSKSKPNDLTEKDILEIISIINKCPSENKGRKLKSEDYRKQCVAAINRKMEKEIFITCRCKEAEFTHFQYGIGIVFDGGPCHMTMKVNLTTHQCYDVHFNGY